MSTPAPRERGRVVKKPECDRMNKFGGALQFCGAVAQLGERCNRTAEARGSIPLSSINRFLDIAGRRPVGRRVPMAVSTANPGRARVKKFAAAQSWRLFFWVDVGWWMADVGKSKALLTSDFYRPPSRLRVTSRRNASKVSYRKRFSSSSVRPEKSPNADAPSRPSQRMIAPSLTANRA